MKITLKMLEDMGACVDGKEWFIKSKKRTLKSIIPALLKENHADYARWLLSRLMTQPQRVLWACYSVELIAPLFEKQYPNDKRPRKAIAAARAWLISAYVAANAAASAAANAANDAAANDDAANAAAYAANAAAAANAAKRAKTNKKIMDYGMALLGEGRDQ